eukprot:9790341-Karenia_brevis.AAC.1
MEQKDLDETRLVLLWEVIKENIADNVVEAVSAVWQLSDPSIFMMLGLTDVSLLNDLIFLDYLTDRSHAFCYMTNLLQQLVCKRKPPNRARHMQLPLGMDR